MTFFTAVNGHLYAADQVAEIVLPDGVSDAEGEILKHWYREGRVVLKSGVDVAVHYGHILAMLEAPLHMVPAMPGTVMVNYDGAHDRVWRTVVTGWAYTRKGDIVPVTPAGVGYTMRSGAVVAPDGSVDNNMSSWPNEDAWRAWAIEDQMLVGGA
jgi:hypothetical protein